MEPNTLLLILLVLAAAAVILLVVLLLRRPEPVSYTHLDVYKRQVHSRTNHARAANACRWMTNGICACPDRASWLK